MNDEIVETKNQTALLASLALAGIAYFAVVLVGLHVLDADLNPFSRTTSEYAVGRYRNLMISAFLALTICCPALALGLRRGLSESPRSRVGLVLLGFFGLSALVALLFPIDPEFYSPTVHGTIHRINGAIGFSALTVGVALLTRQFAGDESWKSQYPAAFAMSFVMILAYLATLLGMVAGFGFEGLIQRIYLAAFIVWFLLTAAHLRALSIEN